MQTINKHLFSVLVCCFVFIGEGIAQTPFFRDQQFQKINSNTQINTIVQGSNGRIWIGTSAGLFHFDGFDFVKPDIDTCLHGQGVRTLCAVENGSVLLGSENGLLLSVDGKSCKTITPAGYDTGFAVTDIIKSANGVIWVSTYGNGIYKIENNTAVHYTSHSGLPDDFVYCLTADKKGFIWAGTDNGLVCMHQSNNEVQIKTYSVDQGLPDNIVRQVVLGPYGQIWVGTFENGVALLDEKLGRFTVPENLKHWKYGHINCMLILENEFWIGTDEMGILDYEFAGLGRIRLFESDFLDEHKAIDCMMMDNTSNVWIGSSNTLLFTSGERIEFISKACGKAMGNIRAVLSDRAGNTWASTNEGVIRFYSDSSGANICDKPLDGTPYQDYKIVSMYMDAYDRIWLGTFDHGVLIFDPVKHVFKQLKESDGLLNNNVMSITGTGNTIWLGTLGGVSGCYFPVDSGKTKPKFFTLPGNGSGNNFIYKVYEDSKHRLLTGTDGQGVGIYDGRLFNNYGTEHGLKSGIIYSLTEDFKGRIWAAAAEGGLYCFDGTSIKNYNRSKGLSDLSIAALSTDESGNIVIVNKSGIDVMDPENGHIITLGQELGVNTIDPDLNCISKDVYGNTWIGSQNGIIKIRLGESASMFRPLLRLRHVLCFLEPVDTSVEKKFSHSRNHISFDYSGIWYDNPNAVTFRYLLEGYNTGWVDTRDRFVTFPNLVPGNYTFRLKCALNNNFTDADEVSYSFVIALPFWRESWFLIFITVVITILLIFYLRFRDNRTRSLESLNRERIQAQFEVLKNQVNPHFLFNSFNTLITIIEDDPAKAINYVNKLSDFFRRILTHKEKDVIPLPQELGLLNDYLFLQKQRHGDAFIMEMRLPDKKTLEKYSLPPLSLQMLVENAFKHNAVKLSSPLRIEIFMNDDGNIVIRNNKISRMKSEPSTSTGLTNLKNRYKLLCGQEPVIHDNFDSFTVILPAIKS